MKKIPLLLVLIFIFQIGFAQEGEDEKKKKPGSDVVTVFEKTNWKVTGGVFAPEMKLTSIKADNTVDLGLRLGMIVNRKVAIGVVGYGTVTGATFDHIDLPDDPLKLKSYYGGLFGEYIIFSKKSIHFTIPVMAGVGYYSVKERDDRSGFFDPDWEWRDWDEVENSYAFVVEPGVNVEFNLLKFMRLNIGAAYRIVLNADLDYLSDTDLTKLSFSAGLRFGRF